MPATHDQVTVAPAERPDLLALVSTGKAAAYRLTRARILWQAAQGSQGPAWADAHIHQALHVGRKTVERTRETFVAVGLEAALQRTKRARPGNQKFDGRNDAPLIAVACSTPPAGHKRWTLPR
jgi:hypothetical protein